MGLCVARGFRPLSGPVGSQSEMAAPQRGGHTLGPAHLEPPLVPQPPRCSASPVVFSVTHQGWAPLRGRPGPPLPRVGLSTGLEKGMSRRPGVWRVPGSGDCVGNIRDVPFGSEEPSHPVGTPEPWGPRMLSRELSKATVPQSVQSSYDKPPR